MGLGSFLDCFSDDGARSRRVRSAKNEIISNGDRVHSWASSMTAPLPTRKDISSITEKTISQSSEPSPEGSLLRRKPASRYHTALLVTSKGRYEVMKVKTQEQLASTDVLVSTRAVGLNPIDWKSVDFGFCLPEFPWVTGRELSGVVEKVGSGVTALKVGDKVWSSTYYKKREAGCFQSRVVAPAHTVVPLPAGLSFEGAACLGVPGLTAAMTLWHWLKIPMPSREFPVPLSESMITKTTRYLLVWGGSTVTGQFAIQLAVLSGLTVITVTSSKTRQLVQELGAKHVIIRDEKDEKQILEEIRRVSGDNLCLAIDLVGPKTATHAVEALSRTADSTIAPLSFLPKDFQTPSNVTVANVEMKQFVLDDSTRRYAIELNRLLEQHRLRIPAYEIVPGGLAGVPEGLERLKRGDMGGKKLIVGIHKSQ